MKKYIGTKTLLAKPMTRGDYDALQGWTITANENPSDEGYLVEYLDGDKPNHRDFDHYISWSPKDVFERAYRPTTGMTFGLALEALKQGKKVTRAGWNGRGMFLWLKPACTVQSDWCQDDVLKDICDSNGGEIFALGTICMFTHDSTGRKAILTGWLASQSDMLLEDWEIVE
ncbi:MAG: DUF2829 domain-containing protein [Planctomycetaceae bacterium]|nr:DUF2829 domain-containing protein [Planctomycetaceae bacterium]